MYSSYAALVAQVAGVLVAGFFLRRLLVRRYSFAVSTALAATILLGLLATPAVWAAIRGLDGVRAGLAVPPGFTEREKCLVDGGRPDAVGLARFLQQRMPPEARFTVRGKLPYVCLQLAVLPRRMVERTQPHEYTVYVGPIPSEIRSRARQAETLPPESRSAEAYGEYRDDVVLVREG